MEESDTRSTNIVPENDIRDIDFLGIYYGKEVIVSNEDLQNENADDVAMITEKVP